MKKPLSILAIAIILSAQIVVPVSRIYADDAAPADSTSSDPTPASATPAPSPDDSSSSPSTSAASDSNQPTDTPPGPPAGGGPIIEASSTSSDPSNDSAISTSTPPVTVPASSSVGSDTDVASTSPIGPEATSTDPTTASSTVDSTISNTATTTSTAISNASTGGNSATSTDDTGTTTIQTGDAVATANVVNIVNVNLFDSTALIAFLNNLSAGNTNVDLDSSAFGANGPIGCSGCDVQVSTTSDAAPSSVSESATNTASIGTAEIVRATTGDNSASGGDSNISTGNAYAAGNVATLANATLVNSNYVMLVLNTFGSWGGDLILPGASFWDSFLNMASSMGTGSSGSNPSDISVANAADVSTDATTSADTGNNTASSTDGASSVQTGSAQSSASSINDVNQTHVGGGAIDIIFHIFGNWSGQALNLPPGFTAIQTPDGLEIVASNAGQSLVNQGALALSTANNASVQNNLDVSASTGGNSASGTGANISTGNAYAAANSITAANVTSVSHNWLAAIVNVFGDWNGNVTFGAPDLWVGIRADLPDSSSVPGSRVVYHYTVKNNGDVAATNVQLSRTIGSDLIDPDPSDPGGVWDLGTLQPGEVREIDETATVAQKTMNTGPQSVSDSVQVTENETDAHPDDNSDVISMIVGPVFVGGGTGTPGAQPDFTITKTSDATTTIAASSTVDYTIHLFNRGGRATHAIVTDQITDESGDVINRQNWDLGAVGQNEDIVLKYTALFSASSTPGVYSNSALVFSADGQFATSSVASTSVTIGSASPEAGPLDVGLAFSSFGSQPHVASISRYMTDATSTVRRPLQLSFLGTSAPLPPDAGGPMAPVSSDQNQLASVGAAPSNPFSWSLYLLVLAGGAWYLVSKRKSFGRGIAEQKQ